MKVIATENGFYKGRLVKAMEEFEFTGKKLGKWMAPAGSVEEKGKAEEKGKDEGPTRKEIMTQLEAAGVEFKPSMNKPELMALLEETLKKLNPAGSDAPDKSLQNL